MGRLEAPSSDQASRGTVKYFCFVRRFNQILAKPFLVWLDPILPQPLVRLGVEAGYYGKSKRRFDFFGGQILFLGPRRPM